MHESDRLGDYGGVGENVEDYKDVVVSHREVTGYPQLRIGTDAGGGTV